jgi:beta-phosphoglucomutase-like phosphatase (HAD superfamily)
MTILFDWDGTTSLLRAGWGELMTAYFLEHLPALEAETLDARHKMIWKEIMRLNGRPSIHQMLRLVELIEARGGTAQTADVYQEGFLARLHAVRLERMAVAKTSSSARESLLVPGVRSFLEALRSRGIPCALATGTPFTDLHDEIAALDLADLFPAGVFAPTDEWDTGWSKRAAIAELIAARSVAPAELLAIGDGPVEIRETILAGGRAVAIACDEHNPASQRPDPWKSASLREAGAEAVFANFRDPRIWEIAGLTPR